MNEPSSGTVTFLFTDIEGSTRLWEQYPNEMRLALARHDAILREQIEAHGGYVFKTIGDAFCASFAATPDALAAVLACQRGLLTEPWGTVGAIKARMALHCGSAEWQGGDYFAPSTLNRLNRLLTIGHGGQVLLSLAAQQLVRDYLPAGVSLRDLGERRLRDLNGAERIYQLLAADLPAEFPPLRTLDDRPNNLPAQSTSFIGREEEVATNLALLRRPDVRLLTLSGPGGTGKTRLSLQVAADAFEAFEHGVYFVPLAAVSDPGLVAASIVQAVGMKEGLGQSVADDLREFLRNRNILLVLDNFEQVVSAATLVADLLASAPRLKVIVSSREALRIYGEYEYAVPPLVLPSLQPLPPLAELAAYPTVALFVSRATAARSSFALTAENAATVAEICVRLDGLPLAIELAAARIKLFSPSTLLARLDSRLVVLTSGARDLPDRQRSLRGAIDWSYDLLGEEERRLFARLAVFAEGWRIEAAETVCAGEDLPDVFGDTASLLDKSLIRQSIQVGGENLRFSMLATIREYAQEKLAQSGEAEMLRDRHADYYVALAEQAEGQLSGGEQVAWLNRLEEEHDNIRAVLGWLLGRGDSQRALRLSSATWRFWSTRGYLTQGQGWLMAALALGGEEDSPLRAKALNGAGVLAMLRGRYAEARECHERSLVTRQLLQDLRGTAGSLNNLGVLARVEGDFEASSFYHEESLMIKRELNDEHGIASSLNNLGVIARDLHNYSYARRLFEESIIIERRVSNKAGIADGYSNLGLIATDEGDYAQATDFYHQSMAIQLELGEKEGVALSFEGLAGIAALVGQPLRAAHLYGAAEVLREEINVPIAPSDYAEYVRKITTARTGLVDTAFGEAWMAGRALTFDKAVAFALE